MAAPAGPGTLICERVRGRRQVAPGVGYSGGCRVQCGSPPGCESSIGKVCTSPEVAGPEGATTAGGGAATAGDGAGAGVWAPLAAALTAATKRRAASEWVVTLLWVIIEVVTASS